MLTMYSTSWCGYCHRLKSQLEREGIEYSVVDIERDEARDLDGEMVERVGQLHAPVLGLYGAKDALAASVPAMREVLIAAGKAGSEIILYPDAGHGFHADYRDSYNAADAKDGWTRMLAFLAKNGVGPRRFT